MYRTLTLEEGIEDKDAVSCEEALFFGLNTLRRMTNSRRSSLSKKKSVPGALPLEFFLKPRTQGYNKSKAALASVGSSL